MRFKLAILIFTAFAISVTLPVYNELSAQSNTIDDGEGTVIEEKHANKLEDADATSPAGIEEAPTPKGLVDEATAAPQATASEAEGPGEGKVKIDEEKVEKIIPSYSFGMKKLMKNAEKNIDRIKKELAHREKTKKKAMPKESAEQKPVASIDEGKQKEDIEKKDMARQESRPVTHERIESLKPERRKCEVSSKPRVAEARMARQKCEEERRARIERLHQQREAYEAACARAKATEKTAVPESKEPAITGRAAQAPSADDKLAQKIAKQEEDMKSEQDRFTKERARYMDRAPSITSAAIEKDQARQEEDMKAEQERFARERVRYQTKEQPVGQEALLKTWEKYGVATKEELAREKEYLKSEKESK